MSGSQIGSVSLMFLTARGLDLRKTFGEAGFDSDPEQEAFNCLKDKALGNISWVYSYIELASNCLEFHFSM